MPNSKLEKCDGKHRGAPLGFRAVEVGVAMGPEGTFRTGLPAPIEPPTVNYAAYQTAEEREALLQGYRDRFQPEPTLRSVYDQAHVDKRVFRDWRTGTSGYWTRPAKRMVDLLTKYN